MRSRVAGSARPADFVRSAPLRPGGPRLFAFALFLAAACIPRVPVQHLPSPTEIAVAYVVDPEHEGPQLAAPEGLKDAIASVLADRNLKVREVTLENPGKLSAQRMAALEAQGAPYALLVEVRVTFFSQIEGRWRWDVATRLTAAQKGQPRAEDSFTAPAVMLLERQQAPEAMEFVADAVSARVGTLLDGVISAPAAPAAAPRGETAAPAPAKATAQAPAHRDPPGSDSIYFVMVDRFANGDRSNDADADPKDPAAFHGGDLAGLRERLDWIQGLGFRSVWLSPVFAMRQTKFIEWGAYHGYWTFRPDKLEPRFGTEKEFSALADDLHARGMRLYLDVVLNHLGHDAPLAKEHPKWFHHQGPIKDWNDREQLENGEIHGLPDFDQDNEEAYRFLLDSALKWARLTHADGFRLDAVKHAPARFWRRFAADVHKELGPQFLLLGEYLDADASLLSQVQSDDGLDAVFDFPLGYAVDDVFCNHAPPARLYAALSSDRLYRDPAKLVTLADNHDLPRLATKCHGDFASISQALHFLLTTRGTPSIIWGTESLQAGEKEPANRADMRFDSAPLREPIGQWMKERNQSPALSFGAPWLVEASVGVLAYLRVHPDQLALVVVNQRDQAWTPGAELTALGFSGEPVEGRSVVSRELPVAPGKWAELAARADRVWRTGEPKRQVRFTAKVKGELAVAGSAPELGVWKPERALKLSKGEASVQLPVRSVLEYKLTRVGADGKTQWEPGANRWLVVEEGEGPLVVALDWRGS